MKYRLILVGRRAQDPLVLALEDYSARLGRYLPTEIVRLRESTPTAEAELMLRRVTRDDFVVALDPRGQVLSTEQMVTASRSWSQENRRSVVFVVGGADGLTDAVRARAQAIWSFGRITLPHRLAHVVLAEQLYRVQTILRGEKYHRA